MPVTTVLRGAYRRDDDLDFLADLDLAAFDATGADRAAAGDREDVFDRHQERFVPGALRRRDVAVDRVHQCEDRIGILVAAFTRRLQRLEARTADDRNVVARGTRRTRAARALPSRPDQFEQLFIVDHVDFVEEHDDVRNADLLHQQNVLARLRHRSVGRRDDQDRAVHLRRAGDHVLDVVGVTGAVDVRVVALRGLVLLMRDGDRNTALFFFGRVVDIVDAPLDDIRVFGRQAVDDGRRQRGLAVVDMTRGADVDMGVSTGRIWL